MIRLSPALQAQLDRLQKRAFVVGAVLLVICLLAAFLSPAQFFRAYLSAYQFYLGIALGSMAILMLYHLTGGAWGFLTRRLLEAGMRTLPLLALLFVPIACGVSYLYLWARPEAVAANRNLQGKQLYLNVPFFWFRAALFFALWLTLALVLTRWSRRQDETGNPHLPRKFRLLSAPGLVLYGVTITFASIDWVMSLQPTFHSTIFPPLFAIGQLLSGEAFTVLVLTWLVARPPFTEWSAPDTLNDLGNLLFTFLIMWAYMAFFQFMLVWIGNLPEEIIWYLPRSESGWQWVAWALLVFHFTVPFFLLLLRDVKRDPVRLRNVAALLLFMQLVYMYFQILPSFSGPAWQRLLPDFAAESVTTHWMDFLTPPALGGIWLAYYLWQLKRAPVLPEHDPQRANAEELHRRDEELAAPAEAIPHG